MTGRQAPVDIGPAAADLWGEVLSRWILAPHQLPILEAVARTYDEIENLQADVKARGLLVPDRFSQLKANPSVALLRQHRTVLARLIRELNLDDDPITYVPRP